jgi:hypothetical protein
VSRAFVVSAPGTAAAVGALCLRSDLHLRSSQSSLVWTRILRQTLRSACDFAHSVEGLW